MLKPLARDEIKKIADALEEVVFPPGHNIITQGDKGDTFYILRNGEAVCYMKVCVYVYGVCTCIACVRYDMQGVCMVCICVYGVCVWCACMVLVVTLCVYVGSVGVCRWPTNMCV